jgi:hypothetical protein
MTWGLALVTLLYAVVIASVIVLVLRTRDWRWRGFVLAVVVGLLYVLWLSVPEQRTMFWAIPISLVLAAALSALTVSLREWRARSLTVLGILIALALVKRFGERVAESVWRDVDYVECWPACDSADLVGSLLDKWPAVVGLAVVLVVAAVAILEQRPRAVSRAARSAWRPQGPSSSS